MEPVTILLIIVGVFIVLFLLDLSFTGGSMTMGTVQGIAMMCSKSHRPGNLAGAVDHSGCAGIWRILFSLGEKHEQN